MGGNMMPNQPSNIYPPRLEMSDEARAREQRRREALQLAISSRCATTAEVIVDMAHQFAAFMAGDEKP